MEKEKPVRLLFLDIMRFIALFMMIQGHTIYAMLDVEIRDGFTPGIVVWTLFRGYTAPFFMVIAGAVFTFLLLQQDRRMVSNNVRIRKGLIRVGTLLFWGYFLRMQFQIFYGEVSQTVLENMLAVDVLHIIALGLFLVISIFVITRRYLGLLALTFLALFFVVVYVSPGISKTNYHHEPENLLTYNNLGVELAQNSDKYADSLNIFENDGVIVLKVRPNSRAEEIGLKQNDVIVQMGWQGICHIEDVTLAEQRQVKGDFSDFDVVRGKERLLIPYQYEVGLRPFPMAFSFWMNRLPTKADKMSQFPIFPWLSYILFGAFFGALLAWMKDKGTLFKRLELKLILIGVFFIALSIIGDKIEIATYGQSNFWGETEGMGESVNLVFHRIGIVILVGAVCAFLSRFINNLPKIMNQMSRNTLWLYVGHLIILYWIRPLITLDRFDMTVTLIMVVCMYILMVAQTLIIEKKTKLGSWGAYLKSFVPQLSRK